MQKNKNTFLSWTAAKQERNAGKGTGVPKKDTILITCPNFGDVP